MLDKRYFILSYIDPGTEHTIFSVGGWIITFALGLLLFFLGLLKIIFQFARKHKRKVLVVSLILIAVSGLIITGEIMFRQKNKFAKKIIVLGFDGLSPDLLEPMIKEGKLPNFSQLANQGSYRRLQTTNPAQSPVAWAAFATGQNPGKNGVFDFIVRNPQDYKLSLSLSDISRGKPKRVIKTQCFWQYASDAQIPVIVINCPVTFPPDKIFGKMLSGMGVPDITGTEGTFSFYTSENISGEKAPGGKIFHINKSPVVFINLIGPLVLGIDQKAKNVKVPVKVALEKGAQYVNLEYQNKKLRLNQGEWSSWQEVVFDCGFLKKIKGIFKFYLAEASPELKIYISPINIDPRKPFLPISSPRGYSKELSDKIGLYHTQGIPLDTWAINEGKLPEEALLDQADEILKEKNAIFNFELSRFKRGIFFCYFGITDTIQHMFWRYKTGEPGKYKEIISGWYEKMDEILGNAMKALNKNDTLIVLSDHGFNAFRKAVHINSWLRKNGYLELRNTASGSGEELLKDIDWSRTKAYAIGFGAIYINQKGRERNGIVEDGAEKENLKEEISQKLKQWYDQNEKSNIVHNVYKQEDIFKGEFTKDAPDLYIGLNTGYRASWQTALGGVPKELIEENLKNWSGDHLFDPQLVPGVILTNGRIKKDSPSIYDIAPTVLNIIGFKKEELKKYDLDGDDLFY
jgi:predicted AlkP superfamily phosphohydrolase/phosphomutase